MGELVKVDWVHESECMEKNDENSGMDGTHS